MRMSDSRQVLETLKNLSGILGMATAGSGGDDAETIMITDDHDDDDDDDDATSSPVLTFMPPVTRARVSRPDRSVTCCTTPHIRNQRQTHPQALQGLGTTPPHTHTKARHHVRQSAPNTYTHTSQQPLALSLSLPHTPHSTTSHPPSNRHQRQIYTHTNTHTNPPTQPTATTPLPPPPPPPQEHRQEDDNPVVQQMTVRYPIIPPPPPPFPLCEPKINRLCYVD
jgi:hypothetical protein